MKYLALAIASLLSACSYQEAQQFWTEQVVATVPPGTKYVKVLGRTWTVSPLKDQPSAYVAQRDNLDLNPYGAPAVRRTPQAVRAIQLATGCRVVRSTVTQDTSARFFASVACR